MLQKVVLDFPIERNVHFYLTVFGNFLFDVVLFKDFYNKIRFRFVIDFSDFGMCLILSISARDLELRALPSMSSRRSSSKLIEINGNKTI